MERRAQINAFTLAAHRWSLNRLAQEPHLAAQARDVLQRWRSQAGGASRCHPYWDEGDALLASGIEAVKQAVCIETDHAATQRSVSPLGRFMPAQERYRLLRQVRDAA